MARIIKWGGNVIEAEVAKILESIVVANCTTCKRMGRSSVLGLFRRWRHEWRQCCRLGVNGKDACQVCHSFGLIAQER